MLKLDNLKSPKSTRRPKRIGRGQGSGQGTQAGKGHKGQKARSGGGVRTGFEGGAMPLYMRLPKKGFSNAPFKTRYAVVKLSQLDNFETVDRQTLIDGGLLKGRDKKLPIKILNGRLDKKLAFQGIAKFSKAARAQVENLGGEITT